MKKLSFFTLFFAVLAVAIMGCESMTKGSTLKGTIKNALGMQVFLEQVQFSNTTRPIGKAEANSTGEFSINDPEGFKDGIYRLRIGAKAINLIFNGSEKVVTVEGDLNDIDQYNVKITGSKDSEDLARVVKESNEGKMSREAVKEFVDKTSNPILGAFLAGQAVAGGSPDDVLQYYKVVGKKLNDGKPGSTYAKDFSAFLTQLETQVAAEKAAETIKIGQPAPEIALPTPEGKPLALSTLKGKVVLLDFWASWCGPCRRANPQVVEIYKKYKDKGFTVFSVSLDGSRNPQPAPNENEEHKQRWIQAIKQDGLLWDNHVSDLKNWGSVAAQTYGVQSIPKTFLIDKNGNIAVINPHMNLETELKKLL